MRYLKAGDFIQMKTGNVAKVLEVREPEKEGERLLVRLRILSPNGYAYQYTKYMKLKKTPTSSLLKYDWRWVKRKFNTEGILRFLSEKGDAI